MKLFIGYPDYILDDDEFNKIYSEVRHILSRVITFPRQYFPDWLLVQTTPALLKLERNHHQQQQRQNQNKKK